MKKTFIALVFLLIATALWSQGTNYPPGAYLSFEEIRQKSPGSAVMLEVERRSNGDIKMNGGNDYRLSKADGSIRKREIRRGYYGYSDGDTLYINCIHYNIQPWYTPVLSDGDKFLVIRGGLSMDGAIQKAQLNNKAQFGYMFGAVGGALQGAKLAMLRFVYVIDKETNQIAAVSSDYLKQLLSSNTSLAEQYAQEEEKYSQEIFIKYLKLMNVK